VGEVLESGTGSTDSAQSRRIPEFQRQQSVKIGVICGFAFPVIP
jgi:hypothetical protein